MSGVGSVANYIFVARSDGVFEIGEIEVGPRWVAGVVFVVGDHHEDGGGKYWFLFSLLFFFRAPAPNE